MSRTDLNVSGMDNLGSDLSFNPQQASMGSLFEENQVHGFYKFVYENDLNIAKKKVDF
jgi:hypothetical protein